MKKALSNIITTVCVILLLWVGISYIDIIADNLSEHPQHSEYNVFCLLLEATEGLREQPSFFLLGQGAPLIAQNPI